MTRINVCLIWYILHENADAVPVHENDGSNDSRLVLPIWNVRIYDKQIIAFKLTQNNKKR